MAFDLKKRWSDTKALYEKTVGARKPPKDFLGFITRAGTGVESGLNGFDVALAAYEKNPVERKTEAFAKLQKAADAATAAMQKYGKTLAERTRKDKLDDPAYSKGLEVLSRDLDGMAAVIVERVKSFRNDEKAIAKGARATSADELLAIGNKNASKNFKLRAATTLKELSAAVAKVRADPDPAFYVKTLMMPLRDIENIFSAKNLAQIGLDALAKSSAYPGKAIDDLGARQTSKRPTTQAEVGKELDAIASRAVIVAAWYKNAVA